jgi:hypothetical protein
MPGMGQAELWLELVTDDVPAAARHLVAAGVVRRDEIEPLPEGFEGFWISSPAASIRAAGSADRPHPLDSGRHGPDPGAAMPPAPPRP